MSGSTTGTIRMSNGGGGGGERPLAGIPFELHGDVNGDSLPDVITAVTDAGGEFWYVGLHPGPYTVSELLPPGFTPTTPRR